MPLDDRAGRRHPLTAARALLALMLGLSVIAIGPGASAQTTAFRAEFDGPSPKPAGCPDGAFVCGHGDVAGFGTADYGYFLDSFARVSASCASYIATVSIALTDSSTLTLEEAGTVCGPGGSFFPQPAPGGSYGNPVNGNGTWEVQSATGQFAGVTGSGTDTFHSAGAHFTASYVGNLDD
jgi:hypothetical protein